jgi:methionyl-tRNA formyltransferase
MRLLFAGTPEIARVVLEKLVHSEHEVLAVLTQPDRPAGRGQKLHESEVKIFAQMQSLKILQPTTLKSLELQQELRDFNSDLLIVVAYGLLIPPEVLTIPKYGCWNVHVSLLPRWRGAAPIQRALEAGDEVTGVSIMQMDAGLDTGPILLQKTLPILPEDTAFTVHQTLATLGAETLLRALDLFVQQQLTPQAQIGDVTYAKKLTKEEGRLDFNLPARVLERKIRAFYPWPMAYTEYAGVHFKVGRALVVDDGTCGRGGEIIAVQPEFILVQTASGKLRIELLQKAGSKMLSVREFLQGHPHYFSIGHTLG